MEVFLMRKLASLTLALVVAGGVMIATPASAAAKISNGAACTKLNATTTVSGSKYKCAKNPLTTYAQNCQYLDRIHLKQNKTKQGQDPHSGGAPGEAGGASAHGREQAAGDALARRGGGGGAEAQGRRGPGQTLAGRAGALAQAGQHEAAGMWHMYIAS